MAQEKSYHGANGNLHHSTYVADYYPKTKKTPAMVRFGEIIEGRYYFQPDKYSTHMEIAVSGKHDARALVDAHHATPWNF